MRLLALAALAAVSLIAAEIPRPAQDMTFSLPNGKEARISDYRGKVVVIEFLLTTCSHCQHASQELNRVYRDLGPQGLQPIGIAVNEMANMLVADYVKQLNLDFPVGWSFRDRVVSFLQHPVMLMMSFPNVVVIDRQGIIRHQFPGGDKFFENEEKNLREVVLPLLKPAGAARKK